MREDISGEHHHEGEWLRVTCDARNCGRRAEGPPKDAGSWLAGWRQAADDAHAHTGNATDYCPDHASLASA